MSADKIEIYKIKIVGDAGVGKTSLILRYADDVFHESFPTIDPFQIECKIMTCQLDGKTVKLHIGDSISQESLTTIAPKSDLHSVHGILVVFALDNQTSFEKLKPLLKHIDRSASAHVVKVMTGTKCDLHETRMVSTETAQAFCDNHQLSYIETSAKENTNVEKLFLTIASEISTRLKLSEKEGNCILS